MNQLTTLEDYEPLVGADAVARVRSKAREFENLYVANINSTYYGGGVAETLSSLSLLMNDAGIKTEWRVIQGAPDFFGVTKKFHNALQGGDINLTELKREIYQEVIRENAVRNWLPHDFVVVHDPQPLPLIKHFKKNGPWIWRCHIDLTDPNPEAWSYLRPYVEQYDGVVLSLEEYRQDLSVPQVFFMPAIDPFTIKNRQLSDRALKERLDHYGIPTDLPLVTQISRFDRWKDPEGVIQAFKRAREDVDATLVLLGNVATDDPEGEEVYQSLLDERDDRIIILSREDTALVNALQSKSSVVLQKSLREGFGLTVTEAMWKGTPVIGGDVGGIRHQIEDGENGFLVTSVEEAAERTVQLLRDNDLRQEMGRAGRASVRDRFLMIRLLEQYVDLIGSFSTVYQFSPRSSLATGPPAGSS